MKLKRIFAALTVLANGLAPNAIADTSNQEGCRVEKVNANTASVTVQDSDGTSYYGETKFWGNIVGTDFIRGTANGDNVMTSNLNLKDRDYPLMIEFFQSHINVKCTVKTGKGGTLFFTRKLLPQG